MIKICFTDGDNVSEWKCFLLWFLAVPSPKHIWYKSPYTPIQPHWMIMNGTVNERTMSGTDPGSHLVPLRSHSNPDVTSSPNNLQQFADETTLHGLSHVVKSRSSRVQRFIWATAFIACLCLFVHHSITAVTDYFHYHHITKVDEKVTNEINFPAVTFCNINPLRISTLTSCEIEHLKPIWPIREEDAENISHSVGAKPECCGRFDWESLYNRSAHRLWDMVKTCRFKKANCTEEDFEPVSNFLACL